MADINSNKNAIIIQPITLQIRAPFQFLANQRAIKHTHYSESRDGLNGRCGGRWWSSDVGFDANRRRFRVEARVRFALPKSWLNLTGSQPRLCTYPGLALGRSSAAYTPGLSLLIDQSK